MSIDNKINNLEVLESLGSQVAVIDERGNILSVNKTWNDFAEDNGAKEIAGVSTGSNYFDVCEKSIQDGNTDAAIALEGIKSVFKKVKQTFEFEYPCHSPTEKRWSLLHVMHLGNDSSRVVVMHQDISKRKNAESDLKASELKYRRLFEASKDGILILNAESGKIVDVNPFLITNLSYPYNFFIGKELLQIGLFSDVEESKKAFIELREKKYIRYENMPLKKHDGGIMNVEFISNVYNVDSENVIQCNIRDITESCKVNLQLKENEFKYRQLAIQFQNEKARLLEAQSVAKIGSWEIVVADLSLNWSNEVYRIFELDPDRFSPTWEKLFEIIHPEDREKVRITFFNSLKENITTVLEHRIVTSTGNLKYLEEHWEIIKNENGEPIRTIGTCQDITDKKKMEIEAQDLLEQLQTKNQDLRQFTYILSHNLRSHIAKIQGLVYLINKGVNDKEENQSFLQIIMEEVSGIDEVIRDLNQILSIQNTLKEAIDFIDFDTILKQVMQVLSIEIKESGVLITTDFTAYRGVKTIKSYCYSIIYNLLSNAIKYRSTNRQSTIHLKSTSDNAFVCLSVKDNGMGIDLEKNKEKVFSLYKRFHGNKIPGKGMGLNLVKVQVESLGGRVELESKVDQGSEFKIYIPIH